MAVRLDRSHTQESDFNGMTPLMYAAKYDRDATLQLLLEAGVDVEHQTI